MGTYWRSAFVTVQGIQKSLLPSRLLGDGFPILLDRVLLGGLEPSLLAPEANALSTELQEREADFTINTGSLMPTVILVN